MDGFSIELRKNNIKIFVDGMNILKKKHKILLYEHNRVKMGCKIMTRHGYVVLS